MEKLRRKQIISHEAANVYLRKEYLPEHNQRFARVAKRAEDYHRCTPRAAELDKIFRLETERTVSGDWVVRYNNRFFQLQAQSRNYAPAGGKVLVCEGRHGNIAIEYRGESVRRQEIPAPARPRRLDVPHAEEPKRVAVETVGKKWTPPANHPWREAARRGLEKRERRTIRRRRAPRPSLALANDQPTTSEERGHF